MEKEALCESLALCKVLPAELGDEVGDVAALCVAIEASKRI
jgi:glucokinase